MQSKHTYLFCWWCWKLEYKRFICITNTITKCWGALIYLLEFFFLLLFTLEVLHLNAHSSYHRHTQQHQPH